MVNEKVVKIVFDVAPDTEGDPEAFSYSRERGYERVSVGEADMPCVMCAELTRWLYIPLGNAPICSYNCADEMWTNYFDTLDDQVKEIKSYEAAGETPNDALEHKLRELGDEVFESPGPLKLVGGTIH